MYLVDTDDVMEDDEKTHICNVCEKEFSSHTNLQRHVTILHLKKHWSFKTKDSKKDLPENETLRCNLCPLNFSSASEKIQHLFEIHEYFKDFPTPPNPTKNSSYDANIESQFKEKESKKDEKKVKFDLELNSTNDVTAEEETRQKQFETLSLDVLDLPRPIIDTPKSNENTFHKCKICNKIFTFQGILNFHMITSHEPKKVAIIQGFSSTSKRKSVAPKKRVDSVGEPVTFFFRRKPKHSPAMPLSMNVMSPILESENATINPKTNDESAYQEVDVERVEKAKEIFDEAEEENNESEVKTGEQNKTYTCLLCSNIFTNIQTLQTHFTTSHDIEMFMCNNCSKIFLVEETYEKHKCGTQKQNENEKVDPLGNDGNIIKDDNSIGQVEPPTLRPPGPLLFRSPSPVPPPLLTMENVEKKSSRKTPFNSCSSNENPTIRSLRSRKAKIVSPSKIAGENTDETEYDIQNQTKKFKKADVQEEISTSGKVDDSKLSTKDQKATYKRSTTKKEMRKDGKKESTNRGHVFPCLLCDRTFPQKRFLGRHLLSIHGSVCYSQWKNTWKNTGPVQNIRQNQKIKIPNQIEDAAQIKMFSCQLCEKSFSKKSFLASHVIRIHGYSHWKKEGIDNKRRLSSRNRKMSSKLQFDEHFNLSVVADISNTPLEQKDCKQTTDDNPTVGKSVSAILKCAPDENIKSKTLKCNQCGRMFHNKSNLGAHKYQSHKQRKLDVGTKNTDAGAKLFKRKEYNFRQFKKSNTKKENPQQQHGPPVPSNIDEEVQIVDMYYYKDPFGLKGYISIDSASGEPVEKIFLQLFQNSSLEKMVNEGIMVKVGTRETIVDRNGSNLEATDDIMVEENPKMEN